MLKRRIIVQILIVLLIQCILGTTTLGDLITMTYAEQQVGGEIGYTSGGTDNTIEEQLDPDPDPKGLGSTNLGVSFADNGVSIYDSLTTVFSGDEVTGNGSAFASAEWGSQPLNADDVHGGGGSRFALYFTRESSPAYFHVHGQIDIDLENYPDLHPEEVLVYVKLSYVVGGLSTTIWEDTADGGSGDILLPFAHGLWLETGKIYLLEAYAEAGTVASVDHPDLKSRTASFSFTATVEPIQLDIDLIGISSCKQFRDGVPQGSKPWSLDIGVRVVDSGALDHIDITKPGATISFVTLYEEATSGSWDCSLDTDYTSLSTLRVDYPEGIYRFDFLDSEDGLIKSLNIDYTGLPGEPTEPVEFIYPSTNNQSGVSVNPTFMWSVSPDTGDALMMAVDNDEVVYFDAPVSISSTSWTPGSLLNGHEYELDVLVMNIKDWAGGPAFPTMTDSTGETFSYSLTIEYMNEIEFTTKLADFCGPNSGPPDGYVDYWDLLYFAQRWHTRLGEPLWDQRCDLAEADDYVDYWDLLVFAQQWHKGEPP